MKQNLILLTVLLTALSAFPAEYYVDASRPDDSGVSTNWATAKKTIQAAVDLAVDGDTVWVTNGVYNLGGKKAYGGSLTNRVCVEKAIYLRSVNGSEQTSIVGQGPLTNSAIRCVYLARWATLSGFTLTNGYTMGFGGSTYEQAGGGVILFTNSVVENCVLADNQARFGGGGAYCYGGGTLNNCTFLRNHADNNVYGYGGGVYVSNAGELNNCNFYGNSGRVGGGASLSGGGVLNKCRLWGNSSTGVRCSNGGVLNNCLIYKNGGDGVSIDSAGVLNNCTVFGNSSYGVYSSQGGQLVNCIIWGNGFGNIAASGNLPVISYTCSYPLQPGGGNISNAPLFATESTDDYRLRTNSPCINAGDNTYVPTNSYDLIGNPRIIDETVDMGAYEGGTLAYTITTTAGTNGTITPSNPLVFEDRDQTFSMLPVTGYRVESLTVDGVSAPVAASYIFTNVQSAHTIEATFVIDPRMLTVENGSGDGTYTNGTVVPISADAAPAGYMFTGWTANPASYNNRIENASAASTTFTMPASNVVLTATYSPSVIYVDASRPDDSGDGLDWATAKKTIQAGVNIAKGGATVLVTNGVYNTGGIVAPGYALTNRVCITSAVTVRSVNGPMVTIIKGAPGSNGSNDVNAVRGVFLANGGAVAGFTITNGYVTRSGIYTYDQSAAGIWLSSNCVASNCLLKGNGTKSSVVAYFYNGGTMNNCTLSGNPGDAVSLDHGGTLNNCTLTRNSGYGAYLYWGGTLNNCALTGNAGGGANFSYGGTMNNCTVTKNSSVGAYFYNGGTLGNCIIWDNSTDISKSGGGITISYTCVSIGVTNGVNGCITNNPLFVDGINSNFHLQASSPCINAGHNSYVAATNDLDGNMRIIGGVVDMGAYERQDAGTDADADGIDDLWEMNWFGSRYSANPSTICSNGVNTILQAYVAGLNPKDPQSKFQTSVFCSLPSESILRWNATSGRVYSVYYSTNLLNGFQPLQTNITAGVYTDLVHSAGQGFYRIEVKKP